MESSDLEKIKSMNIYEKLSLITDEIGVVEKGLNVQVTKSSSYKAVRERDVLDAIKPIEKKYRVYSYPSKREIIDKDVLVKKTEYNNDYNDSTKIVETNTLFMRIKTTYKFVNMDKPDEFIETTVYGDGLDTGDKAPGKAMTYADKYALMKAYKLSTGDDPDKEASPTNGYKKNDNEKLSLISKLNMLVTTKKVDYEKLLEFYKVKSNSEMNVEQLKEAINTLEKRTK